MTPATAAITKHDFSGASVAASNRRRDAMTPACEVKRLRLHIERHRSARSARCGAEQPTNRSATGRAGVSRSRAGLGEPREASVICGTVGAHARELELHTPAAGPWRVSRSDRRGRRRDSRRASRRCDHRRAREGQPMAPWRPAAREISIGRARGCALRNEERPAARAPEGGEAHRQEACRRRHGARSDPRQLTAAGNALDRASARAIQRERAIAERAAAAREGRRDVGRPGGDRRRASRHRR